MVCHMPPASPLILHIPHGSTEIPEAERDAFLLDDAELRREILRMTDMHTADIYQVPGAERVVFPVSRLVVDPERFADDAGEIMAARGMGVLYTATSDEKPLRLPLSPDRRQQLLDAWYHPHHRRLHEAVAARRNAFGYAVIVDCHSFPSRALPYERRSPAEARPEICIGTDSFHTPEWMAQSLLSFFAEAGYAVARDIPFAGALVPAEFYRQDARVFSVMIELRRDLYMDEETGERIPGFSRVRADITRGIGELMSLVREKD